MNVNNIITREVGLYWPKKKNVFFEFTLLWPKIQSN